jgi:hypothetical protein
MRTLSAPTWSGALLARNHTARLPPTRAARHGRYDVRAEFVGKKVESDWDDLTDSDAESEVATVRP